MAVNVPDLLRKYRDNERYSQEAMAAFLNISQATYHNWESSKRQIPIGYYPRIAKVCNFPLKDILPPEFGDSQAFSE